VLVTYTAKTVIECSRPRDWEGVNGSKNGPVVHPLDVVEKDLSTVACSADIVMTSKLPEAKKNNIEASRSKEKKIDDRNQVRFVWGRGSRYRKSGAFKT
jgi:hypothetical protein